MTHGGDTFVDSVVIHLLLFFHWSLFGNKPYLYLETGMENLPGSFALLTVNYSSKPFDSNLYTFSLCLPMPIALPITPLPYLPLVQDHRCPSPITLAQLQLEDLLRSKFHHSVL